MKGYQLKITSFIIISMSETLLLPPETGFEFCNHHEKYEEELTNLKESEYFGGTSEGKYHGHANFISNNGELKATVNYKEGKRVGPFTVYKNDGSISCFGTYGDDGKIKKLSYLLNGDVYTWCPLEKLQCTIKMKESGIMYSFNVNAQGKATGSGEKLDNGKQSDVMFKDGKIEKRCWSMLITVVILACGIGAMCYLYFKFPLCFEQTLKLTYSPSQISCQVMGADTMYGLLHTRSPRSKARMDSNS